MGVAGRAEEYRGARRRGDHPGHGEPCTKAYLKEQGQIVENWIGYIEQFADRGLSPDDILKEPLEVTKQDPYPIGQRLFIPTRG